MHKRLLAGVRVLMAAFLILFATNFLPVMGSVMPTAAAATIAEEEDGGGSGGGGGNGGGGGENGGGKPELQVRAEVQPCTEDSLTTAVKVVVTNNTDEEITFTVTIGTTVKTVTVPPTEHGQGEPGQSVTFEGLAAGEYSVTVTGGGLSYTSKEPITVTDCTPTEETLPTVTVVAETCTEDGTTPDMKVTVTNNTGKAASYDVAVPGATTKSTGNVAAGGSGNVTFSGLAAGDYTATVTGSDETSTTKSFTVTACADDGEEEEPQGQIIVHKVTQPANDPTSFSVTLTGTMSEEEEGTPVNETKSVTSAAPATFKVNYGRGQSYAVTETSKAGWQQLSTKCYYGDDTTTDLGSTGLLVYGQQHGTINCYITNQKLGTLTIKKDVVGGTSAQVFSFTTTGSGLSSFKLDDNTNATYSNAKTFSGLQPGTYTVSEGSLSSWKLSGLTCTGASSWSKSGSKVTVALAAGENVVCAFSNTYVSSSTGGGTTPTTTPTQTGGQVLGASTVIPASTATTNGQLANTGDNPLLGMLAGLSLITLALGARFTLKRLA